MHCTWLHGVTVRVMCGNLCGTLVEEGGASPGRRALTREPAILRFRLKATIGGSGKVSSSSRSQLCVSACMIEWEEIQGE